MELTTEINPMEKPTLGTPEQNAHLDRLENQFYESVITMMTKLKEIDDSELYRCRGYESMRDYLKNHIAKSMPFALTYTQSLLALANKMEDSEVVRNIDQSRLVELSKIANQSDVIQIEGEEGLVTLVDGRTMTTEQYIKAMTPKIKKDIEAKQKTPKMKEDLKAAQDKISELQTIVDRQTQTIQNNQIDTELAESLNFVKADDLGKFLTRAGARKMINEEGRQVEASIRSYVASLNTIEDHVKSEPEFGMAVADFIRELNLAKTRLVNAWGANLPLDSEMVEKEIDTDEEETLAIEDNSEDSNLDYWDKGDFVDIIQITVDCLSEVREGNYVDPTVLANSINNIKLSVSDAQEKDGLSVDERNALEMILEAISDIRNENMDDTISILNEQKKIFEV